MGYKTLLYNGKTVLKGGKMILNTFSTPASSRYLIDFGSPTYQTPNNWNNVTGNTTITNLIDTSGITSNISIITSGFTTYFDWGGSDSSIYTKSANRDFLYGDVDYPISIKISGLTNSKIYDLHIYTCYDSNVMDTYYIVNDNNGISSYYLQPYQNYSGKIISPDRVPNNGIITINISGKTATDYYAGIGVLEIIEKTLVTYDSSSIQKVLLAFNTIPTSTGITKAPLKYDKRFALSYVWDDNCIDQYTYGFPYLNGGTAGDSNYYSGKTYTDGCGNKVKFNAGISIFSFNGSAPYPGPDIHTAVYTANIQWNQYPPMYNAGWALTSHSLTHTSSGNYEVERNRSYIYAQTSGCTVKVFTQPSNDTSFINTVWAITGNTKYYEYQNGNNSFWFGGGSPTIPAGRVDNEDLIDGSNRISYAAWPVKDFGMFRTICTSSSEIQNQVADLLEATGTTYHTWKSLLSHSVAGQGGGFGSFDDFKTAMDYIEDNHGSDGADNCWMVNDQDVYEYLVARDTTIISKVANHNTLELTFSWANTHSGNTLPDDMRKYCLSFLVTGNTSVSDIFIYGGTGSTYNKNYKSNTALINLNWNGGVSEYTRLLRVATERVEVAEATETADDKAIAQDYVTSMPAGTDKTNLQNRLNAI